MLTIGNPGPPRHERFPPGVGHFRLRGRTMRAIGLRGPLACAGMREERAMAKKFESPADWAPPGAQFQSRGVTSRTLSGVLFGLIVTPIGIAFAAKGGADIRYWVIVGAVTDRWTAALEIFGGS